LSIENTTPKQNEIAFKWLNNYSGITIKTPSKTLVVDPVDIKAREFVNVDAILITHEHYDHLDSLLLRKILERTRCECIYADSTSAKKLNSSISSEKILEMMPGTSDKIGKVIVEAKACNHPSSATPITFLITSEDGLKIYHTADSMPFPEMERIGEEFKPDLAFCAVGVALGVSPTTGMKVARMVRPKVAVPYHTGKKADLFEFCECLSKEKADARCLVPELGNVYIVGKTRKKGART
jgi:L-ascorbate metabolism protein UlaG (beta-lactamase superfamily)